MDLYVVIILINLSVCSQAFLLGLLAYGFLRLLPRFVSQSAIETTGMTHQGTRFPVNS